MGRIVGCDLAHDLQLLVIHRPLNIKPKHARQTVGETPCNNRIWSGWPPLPTSALPWSLCASWRRWSTSPSDTAHECAKPPPPHPPGASFSFIAVSSLLISSPSLWRPASYYAFHHALVCLIWPARSLHHGLVCSGGRGAGCWPALLC